MVIIEGPDGAGKTTLVQHLVDRFGLEIGERGTTDRNLLYTVTRMDTYTALSRAVHGAEAPRIWDRLFYSELIYPEVSANGRDCQFNESEVSFVQRVINAIRCPVVVCLPPIDVVRANVKHTKQMDGVTDKIDEIWARYHEFWDFGYFPDPVLLYDYTGKHRAGADLEDIEYEVRDYMEERERRMWSHAA